MNSEIPVPPASGSSSRRKTLCGVCVLGFLLPLCLEARLEVSDFFGDHMVLQRDKALPVWGTAAPGDEVNVSFREDTVKTSADGDGNWMVKLPPQPAGMPGVLQVRAGEQTIRLEDVLVGEVWIASGQSNMAWTVKQSNDADAETAAANHPKIRLFNMPRVFSPEPLRTIDATWEVCSPETVGDFSAVAYYFGRKLQQELGVPIGLVSTSWGGTRAEPWTPLETLQANPLYEDTVADYHEKVKFLLENPGLEAELAGQYKIWTDTITELTDNPPPPGAEWFDMSKPIPGSTMVQSGEAFFEETDGMAQVRAEFPLTEDQAHAGGAVIKAGLIDNYDVAWINGVEVGRIGRDVEAVTREFREYPIPDGTLKAGSNVVVLQIVDWYRGAVFGQDVERVRIEWPDGDVVELPSDWEMRVMVDVGARPETLDRKVLRTGSFLYNGMIAPLVPAAFRGVIWYQGESNTHDPERYQVLFPDLIRSWREAWGQGDFPFYFVQLANLENRPGWPELREAQRQTLKLPNTGMAVTIDIGEAKDIHPRNKQDVGLRLALWALAKTYEKTRPAEPVHSAPGSSSPLQELIPHSGPLFKEAVVETGRIRLLFDHTGGGLSTSDGGPLTGFLVAESAGDFLPAEARIEGEEIIITRPDLQKPAEVRYAWESNPVANLINDAGLPASPFRTDSRPFKPVEAN